MDRTLQFPQILVPGWLNREKRVHEMRLPTCLPVLGRRAYGITPDMDQIPTANLKGRWDASVLGLANNANVVNFTDQGPNGYTGVGNNGGHEVYKTNIRNSLSVVRMDGLGQAFTAAIPAFGGDQTVYIVGAWSSTTANPTILADANITLAGGAASGGFVFYNDGSLQVQANDGSTGWSGGAGTYGVNMGTLGTSWFVADAAWTSPGLTGNLYVSSNNTSSGGTGTMGNSLVNKFIIGGLFNAVISQVFVGDIGEIILYTVAHNSSQRATIRSLLKSKWGF